MDSCFLTDFYKYGFKVKLNIKFNWLRVGYFGGTTFAFKHIISEKGWL